MLANKFFTKELAAEQARRNIKESNENLEHLQKLKEQERILKAQLEAMRAAQQVKPQPGFIQTHLNSLLEAIYSVLNATVLIGKAILAYITSERIKFLSSSF